MIWKNYRNFFLWIVSVALLAATVGFFLPAKDIRPAQTTQQVVTARGGRAAVTAAQNPAASSLQKQTAQAASGEQKELDQNKPADQSKTASTAVPAVQSMSFLKLKQLLESNPAGVKGFTFDNGTGKVTVKRDDDTQFTVQLPDAEAKVELRKRADELKIDYQVIPAPAPAANSGGFGGSLWMLLGIMVIGSIISVFVQRWMMGGGMGGGGGFGGGFAKSRGKEVKVGDGVDKVTFDDVAGCDEAVQELKRVVKGLVDRGIYAEFDGELPKGILLVGPPGTGKTLLAKAVASECNGTMRSLAGSDFVEMLVGVGAARVRDEFATARKTVAESGKPYVIFIDEFDAIGGKRGSGVNRGNSEQENTLNQILVEMDGVHNNKGILILAATNRVDMLDEALLRPGRFDAHVSVDLPDIAGREKIFAIHTRKKKLAEGVTTAVLAQRTFGYSGAEIKGVCNRAAIVAAERWSQKAEALKAEGKTTEQIAALLPKEIVLTDFDEGIDFVRLGGAKTGSQASMPREEKENTAYHEGGHALAAAALKGSDPVVKITIMRRARALGYVQYLPTTDRFSFTDEQAVARIICAMAGRAAQEIYLGRVDTGASNDFEQACNMAYQMVSKWGMSRLGNISVGERGPGITGNGYAGQLPYGDKLANEIDAEWRRITAECYQIARYIVGAEKARMEQLVKELMEKETMLAPRWNEFLKEIPTAVEAQRVKFNPAAAEGGHNE